MSNIIVSAVIHYIENNIEPSNDYIGNTVKIISKAMTGKIIKIHGEGDLVSERDPIIRLAVKYEIPYYIFERDIILNPGDDL